MATVYNLKGEEIDTQPRVPETLLAAATALLGYPLEPLPGFEAKLVSASAWEKHGMARIYTKVQVTWLADRNLSQTTTLYFDCLKGTWAYKEDDLLTRLAYRALYDWFMTAPTRVKSGSNT